MDRKARSAGRPPQFRSEYAEHARKYCLMGATDRQLAEFFGITESTVNAWKHRYPRFRTALDEGKAIADAEVARALFERAKGYSHPAVKIFADPKTGAQKVVRYTEHYPPDTTACIFWLKNRHPGQWRDVNRTEVTGKDGGPVEVENAGRDQLLAELSRRGIRPDTVAVGS